MGDLGNECNDEMLYRAFSKYPSLLKVKVIRDKRSNKTKGFGFVSFKDSNDYIRAMREVNGKQYYGVARWNQFLLLSLFSNTNESNLISLFFREIHWQQAM